MPSDWHEARVAAELDAYADWAMGPGRLCVRVFDQPDWYIPVIIVLEADVTADDFRRAVHAAAGRHAARRRCLCIPQWYRATGGNGEPYRLPALVTKEFFDVVALIPAMISRILVGQRLSPAAVNHDAHVKMGGAAGSEPGTDPVLDGPPEKGTVVVGIIDDAIAFAHERFRRGDPQFGQTSRVEHAWVQDLAGDPPYALKAVPYGREFNKDSIDRLIKDSSRDGFVDEDQLYRQAGVIDFSRPGPKALAWRAAHGTHVMDLACGEKPQVADASRPIVCVQLPAAVTAETSGAGLAPYVLDGIWYILDRADEIARKRNCGRLPVVINFSYGFLAGPHDGTHPIELAIDSAIAKRAAPLAVVLPAGNQHLARCHAQVAFGKPDAEVLNWRILPDDETSTFLEIWLPYRPKRAQSRMSVSIAPPGHDFGPALGEDPGKALAWQPDGQHVLCKLSYEFVHASERGRFMVAVLPTASDRAAPALAPSGLWRVRLENTGLQMSDVVHLWIQRDDTPHGYPVRGRQSYFEDPLYERFDPQGRVTVDDADLSPKSLVRLAGTVSAIATGRRSTVVGGLVRSTDKPARYSGRGPITPQAGAAAAHRNGPDALAFSDRSEVRRGVLAAGSRSGSVLGMTGTSIAAPQVARGIADDFAARSPDGALPVRKP